MRAFIKTLFVIGAAFFVIYGGQRTYRHFTRQPPPLPPAREEVTITIIPGWNLRQVADYLVIKGLATSTEAVFAVTGQPAHFVRSDSQQAALRWPQNNLGSGIWLSRPRDQSYEGYLAPETFRVFKDATIQEVVSKFLLQREKELAPSVQSTFEDEKKNFHTIITMASIVEDEAKTLADKKMVADILWRRNAKNWALQVDSSVHYAVDKTGDVFTTDKERSIDSPWNTYKYPGLPPGPICNPSFESIEAALNPTPNAYWYFLSGKDGTMHYAKTLEEHNRNKKYL